MGGGGGGNTRQFQDNFLLFLHRNICCGYSLESSHTANSNEFLRRNNKNEPEHDKINKMTSAPRDQSSLCVQWVAKDPRLLQVDNED